MRELDAEPLTAEAFSAFGSVIEASDDAVKLDINQGHAIRYDALAEIDVADGGGAGVISLFRARPLDELVLRVFERHPLGSQTFVPLGGRPYLVAVAPAGDFNPAQIRLFRAEGHQGVHYRKGTWHHFLLVLEPSDFLVIDRAGPGDNCEEIALAAADEIRVRKIGILAYGSLITDPGKELIAVTVGRTDDVLTPFSVEFARSSKEREGAPTLVPVENGGSPVCAVVFTVHTSPKEAADIVYRREINQVGSDKVYSEPLPNQRNAVRIDRFEKLAGHDLVLSTRLAANIDPLTAEALADLAIESARKLADGRDGISYLIAAQASGIVTPLTLAYQAAILHKADAADLESALATIRTATASA